MSLLAALATLSLLQPAPPPPCEGGPYDDFDFWVGQWEVYDTQGNKAGDNTISKEEGGCLLVERWASASGNTGQSYNFYDLETESWRQVWVSRGITINYEGNPNEDGDMILEGNIAYRQAPGTSTPFKGQWALNEDGTVTQSFHQYNAETEEWDVWFIGEYRRAD